jgi:hypothetical protein
LSSSSNPFYSDKKRNIQSASSALLESGENDAKEIAMDYEDYNTDATAAHAQSVHWLLFICSIILTAAGLWIVLDAMSSYDFMMGGLSILVFGPAALVVGYKLKTKKP